MTYINFLYFNIKHGFVRCFLTSSFFLGLLSLSGCLTGPSKKEISHLQKEPGYQIYISKKCSSCHGKYGDGIFGNQKLRGKNLKQEYIIGKVRGNNSKEMPVYLEKMDESNPEKHFISKEDLKILARFIEKSWGVSE